MTTWDLRNWPIFNFLEPRFLSKIHKVLVYGDLGNEALIVTQDKMVYAIGSNKCSCLGTGNSRSTFYPRVVESLCNKDIKTFAYGTGPHVLALTYAGEVYSWGCNINSELGNISRSVISENSTPSLVSWPPSANCIIIVDVACGSCHSLALSDTGEVYAWGKNDFGQAGGSDTANTQEKPKKISDALNNKKVIYISCGFTSSIAITNNGKVFSWGDNRHGQLGIVADPNFTLSTLPFQVQELNDVIIRKVACGAWHTLALSNNGILFVWGDNTYGQLGISTVRSVRTPSLLIVPKMGKVLDIASSISTNISIAMTADNQIFIWGLCLGQYIRVPMLTSVVCIDDAFAYFASPKVMHKPFVLRENERVHVLQSLKDAFDDPATSDLIIQVQGNLIHVHKFVLKIRCHYFRTMFQKQSMENNQCVIKEDQFSPDVFRAFLRYLYTDEINLDPKNILELFNLANTYSENQLKRQCLQMVKRNIKISNVACLYNKAIAYNIKTLEEFCFKFILNHMTAVVQTPDFSTLDESALKTFIIKAAQAGAFKT